MITAEDIAATLESMRDDERARKLIRFFKTGPGEYGEGDRFLGLYTWQTRLVVREAKGEVPLDEIGKLLYNGWHEVRLAGFLLLCEEMKRALPSKRRDEKIYAPRRDEIASFYLKHARQANNWDLVDLTCPHVIGKWLLHPSADGLRPDRSLLDRLAQSDNLWEQRIAIVSTFALIQAGEFADTLRIADLLLQHPHDLIHKAAGWMLRCVGKKSKETLTDYLELRYSRMPRTMLRYAIERLPEHERLAWLRRR